MLNRLGDAKLVALLQKIALHELVVYCMLHNACMTADMTAEERQQHKKKKKKNKQQEEEQAATAEAARGQQE